MDATRATSPKKCYLLIRCDKGLPKTEPSTKRAGAQPSQPANATPSLCRDPADPRQPGRMAAAPFNTDLGCGQAVIFQRFAQFDFLHFSGRTQRDGVNEDDIVRNLPFSGFTVKKRQ